MSIASEITRLQGVKADILTAIGNKGVTVPTGSALDDCPGLINEIPVHVEPPDLSGYEFSEYVYFSSSGQLNSNFPWYSQDELNCFKMSNDITIKFLIPAGYYSGGATTTLYLLGASYKYPYGGPNYGELTIYFRMVGGSLTFTVGLPGPKDSGNNPKVGFRDVPISFSLVEGVISTLRIHGNTATLNGTDFTINNYDKCYTDAIPYLVVYSPRQVSYITGYRYYGMTVGDGFNSRAAKRLSDNAVCLVNTVTGHASTSSGFDLGPIVDEYDYLYYTINNRVYRAKEIHGKIWLCENLVSITASNNINPTTWNDGNNNVYIGKAGVLYNDAAITDLEQNVLAGTGWRIATNADWTDLLEYAGGPLDYTGSNYAGDKLKGRNGWAAANVGIDNYGFNCVLTEAITSNSVMHNWNSVRYWSDEFGTGYRNEISIESDNKCQILDSGHSTSTNGCLIRLVRDT